MKNIYALAEYGCYEDYGIILVKLAEKDKENFIEFCKDSKPIPSYGIESLNILCFANDIESVDKDFEEKKVMNIQDLISNLKNELEEVNVYENDNKWHAFSECKDIIEKMLNQYNFEVV